MTHPIGWLSRTVMAAAAILFAGGTTAVGQTDPSIFVNVTSKQDKAADKQFGEEYHEGLREMLENRMFNGLKKAYPCIHYLDRSAAGQIIGVERMRELLGGEGESRLPALADAVGAGTLGTASVTVMGGTVVIGGSMMDTSNAKTVGRAQVAVPAGNTDAISAAMDRFVSQLVSSAGSDGPTCRGWQGEISASAAQHDKGKNPNGDPFSLDIDLKITCQIGKGDDNQPPCQLSYSNALVGKDASTKTSAGGQARCNAGFGIYKGIAKISIGSCQIKGTWEASVGGQSVSDKPDLSLGGWEVEMPFPPGSRTLSGSKQVDRSTTVSWNLTWK
jgi:hypothetical protein